MQHGQEDDPHVQFLTDNITLTGTTSDGKYVSVSGQVQTGIVTFSNPLMGQPVYLHGNYAILRR